MQRLLTLSLLAIGASVFAFGAPATPEIDPAAGGSALALLAGSLLVIRSRFKK
jgi:hypothetical protein